MTALEPRNHWRQIAKRRETRINELEAVEKELREVIEDARMAARLAIFKPITGGNTTTLIALDGILNVLDGGGRHPMV